MLSTKQGRVVVWALRVLEGRRRRKEYKTTGVVNDKSGEVELRSEIPRHSWRLYIMICVPNRICNI